ncbi:hypothetical protein [Flavobacterium frigoris]|uniref:Uncharacterized protein n=1 Tax=Flavobacterium frigoris (strain PS1) TaxID=1086011 RepID=H7FPA5_FLAFP|nr:hypothetical protein [Flavobacterium frigoris]EIA09585.1 hypothetical protein HJ01_01003 [Flavobacterium frigoris PS1]
MSSTGIIPKPTTHIYKEINEGKFKTTKHYQLVEVENGTQKLSDLINIVVDRGFAKSAPNFWLKIRIGKRWENFTGLFKTPTPGTYFADKGNNNRKEDLLIVKLSNYERDLTVYYFNGYYTANLSEVLRIIK